MADDKPHIAQPGLCDVWLRLVKDIQEPNAVNLHPKPANKYPGHQRQARKYADAPVLPLGAQENQTGLRKRRSFRRPIQNESLPGLRIDASHRHVCPSQLSDNRLCPIENGISQANRILIHFRRDLFVISRVSSHHSVGCQAHCCGRGATNPVRSPALVFQTA